MRIAVRVVIIAGAVLMTIALFMLNHFYLAWVDEVNYNKTEAMRQARWKKKEPEKEPEVEQTIQLKNRESDRTAEQSESINQNVL